jgi:hypothetical protein
LPPPPVLGARHSKVVCTSDLLDLSLDGSDECDGDHTTTPSSFGLSPENPIEIDTFVTARRWPSNLYACEVSAYFDACRNACEARKS